MASLPTVTSHNFKYEFVCKILETHGSKIYGVKFFSYGDIKNNNIFATVSINRCTIYELESNGKISLLQTYLDDAWDESFYSIIWCVDKKTSAPLVVIAGELGVIKIINCHTQQLKRALKGHGYRINQLINHPSDNNIILSCSDDQSIRIWNIETGACLAILFGHDGHRSAILSIDIHIDGELLLSSGKDHAIKIWKLNNIRNRIDQSYGVSPNHENIKSNGDPNDKQFMTEMIQFPIYSRQKIHTNIIDDVHWFGDLVFSKSIESVIKIWLPPLDDFQKSIQTYGELRYKNSNIYFIKFNIDKINNILGIGNMKGKVYIYDLDKYFELNSKCNFIDNDDLKDNDNNDDVDDDNDIDIQQATDNIEQDWHTLLKPQVQCDYKPIILNLKDCNVTIRQVAFNKSGSLIAVADNGTLYRYDKIVLNNS